MVLAPQDVGFRYYERYDLESDPWEQTNLADESAYAAIQTDLAARPQVGWTAALPT